MSEAGLVWDGHVHAYPGWVAADPIGYARGSGEWRWGQMARSGAQGWSDCEKTLRAMDAAGVSVAVLLGWYWERVDSVHRQNEWMAEWIAAAPDRFRAFAGFHPAIQDIPSYLDSCSQWGAIGIGECLPEVQSPFGWRDDAWQELIDATTARNWPINVHVTDPDGPEYLGRTETSLENLRERFAASPRQRWICAHLGGKLCLESLRGSCQDGAAASMRNVWYDLAAVPRLYAPQVWIELLSNSAADRLVFGSDFPLRLYRGKSAAHGWQGFIDEIAECGLGEERLKALFHGNLHSLLTGTFV